MQNYLKASKTDIKNEEAQMIFKMRSRMTEVKTNFKGMYETLECDACKKEEETQKHVLECEEILKKNNQPITIVKYEEIFNENVKKQIEIVQNFIENLNIKKEYCGIT